MVEQREETAAEEAEEELSYDDHSSIRVKSPVILQ